MKFAKILVDKILLKFGFKLSRSLDQSDIKKVIHKNIIEHSDGILHIGAHYGEERYLYNQYQKYVLWIEGDPVHFKQLEENISKFHKQKTKLALLGDVNQKKRNFYRASNQGESSSIYEFSKNPGFDSINLRTDSIVELPLVRLDSILSENEVKTYSHWIVDVQGAELDVLKGAGKLLKYANSLMVEMSNREIYKNGSKPAEIFSYLSNFNLYPIWDLGFMEHGDVLFLKKNLRT